MERVALEKEMEKAALAVTEKLGDGDLKIIVGKDERLAGSGALVEDDPHVHTRI